MRSGKIISWLFTLAQLIFFIKLVEYVQGAEVSGGKATATVVNFESLASSSIRPSIKSRQSSSDHSSTASEAGSQQQHARKFRVVPETAARGTNHPLATTDTDKGIQSKTDGDAERGCPACEAGGCNTNSVQVGFPLKQIKVAAVLIAIWYFIFLKVWKYPLVKKLVKPQQSQGYAPAVQSYGVPSSTYGSSSGPYGFSGGSSGSNYNDASSSSDDDSSSFGIGSILDTVLKGIEKFSS